MAQHIVALDIGKTAARIAVIAATFRRATLLGVDAVPVEPDEDLSSLFAKVREHIGFPIDSLIVGLDARKTSVRTLRFPFNDTRRIPAAVEFELDGQIPYEMAAVKIVWQLVERDAKQTDVLATLAPRSLLTDQLAALTAAGLEPRALVHPAAALAELTPPGEADEAVATLCVGAQQCHLVIHRQSLRVARTLHWGSDHIDRTLSDALALPPAQARTLKESTALLLDLREVAAASVDDQRFHAAMAQALAPLVTHVASTFKAVEKSELPRRLLLTGKASELAGLPRYLAQRLGLPVEPLDVGAALGALEVPDRTALKAEHAVVLGLALAMFRRGQDVPLNFRQGELGYHGDIQLFRGVFTRLALGFVCVFLAAFTHASVRYGLMHGEEKGLDRGFCQATLQIVGKELCEPARALAALRQSGADGGTVIPPFSATGMLEMLSKSLPQSVDVTFDELDVRVDGVVGQPDRIIARGEAASFETIEQVTALLKHDPCVQEAEVSRQRKSQNANRVEFHLQVKVACPVGMQPGAKLAAKEG